MYNYAEIKRSTNLSVCVCVCVFAGRLGPLLERWTAAAQSDSRAYT